MPKYIEEGDKCYNEGCAGTLEFQQPADCCCNISPPCNACMNNDLTCDKCRDTFEPGAESPVDTTAETEEKAMTKDFEAIGTKIGKLVQVKNAAYGDSFARSGEFLRLLYPDGIRPDQYLDALGLVRVFDKQMRIATAKDALGESPWQDIAGYGILGAANDARGDHA